MGTIGVADNFSAAKRSESGAILRGIERVPLGNEIESWSLSLPVKRDYKLSPLQKAFIQDDHRYCLLQSGKASGKTYAGTLKALDYAIRFPHSLVILLGDSYLTSQQLLEKACDLTRSGWIQSVTKRESLLTLINNSQIRSYSASKIDCIRGLTVSAAYMDEIEGDLRKPSLAIISSSLRGEGHPSQLWETRLLEDAPLIMDTALPTS